jgi:hypothetical protein
MEPGSFPPVVICHGPRFGGPLNGPSIAGLAGHSHLGPTPGVVPYVSEPLFPCGS